MLQEVECIVSDKIIDDEMFYTVRRMDTDEKSEKKLADLFCLEMILKYEFEKMGKGKRNVIRCWKVAIDDTVIIEW